MHCVVAKMSFVRFPGRYDYLLYHLKTVSGAYAVGAGVLSLRVKQAEREAILRSGEIKNARSE